MSSRLNCSSTEGTVSLFVGMASCMSSAFVYMLLRLCFNLMSLNGFVLNVIDWSC